MIINRSFLKEPPIYLTIEPLSYPSLFSSKLSALSLSSKTKRKNLVKTYLNEKQSSELEKGEVDMRKEIISHSEETMAIKSHETVSASSDEITLQKQRDLGVLTNVVTSEQFSNSADDQKDGISKSYTSAKEAVGPSSEYKLPKSFTSGLVKTLYAWQNTLEAVMVKIREKVEAMDSKLDKILSLLLSGHGDDAKKREKSNPDNACGNKDKGTNSNATQNLPNQLTHVVGQGKSGSGVNLDVFKKSGNKDTTSDTVVLKQVTQVVAKEGNSDLRIDSVEEAEKLYQALEIKGNIHKEHYKDPRLFLVDEMAARKLLESEFPGKDIGQILQEKKLYFSQEKIERSKSGRGTGRRGRTGGRRRTPSASMKGVTIPGNYRPNTRASLILPSILVTDKGKKIIEGPLEVKERLNLKADESFSEQVTVDAKLVLINKEEEEEDKESC